MKPTEIINYIESTAPIAYAAHWDKSGIQVASFQKGVSHIGVMLDPTFASIQKAIELGADFLISHHPLTMSPRYPDKQSEYLKIVSTLLRNDICLYSAHTSLDANPKGPASWLADALELPKCNVLAPESDNHGYGFYGKLPQPLAYEEFVATLKGILSIGGYRVCGPCPLCVETVACCPGSGSDFLPFAEAVGADVYITGDVKYHTALDSSIRILDVGHFILEEKMMRLFSEMLQKELQVFVSFIASEDPLIFEG